MDKKIKNFTVLSAVLVLMLFLALAGFWFIYQYSTIRIYNSLLFVVIFFIMLTLLYLILVVGAVIYVYRKERANPIVFWLVKLGMNILLPIIIFLSNRLHMDKDNVRSIYIQVNNILVQSGKIKFKPNDVLLILPHCLQNSECVFKITHNTDNCKQCGKCCVGDIIRIAKEKGVKLLIVTGGTVARKAVKENKPKVILSVACERDLASGILDVKSIPVIGITNERPHGPCFNTCVNVDVLKEKLDDLLVPRKSS